MGVLAQARLLLQPRRRRWRPSPSAAGGNARRLPLLMKRSASAWDRARRVMCCPSAWARVEKALVADSGSVM